MKAIYLQRKDFTTPAVAGTVEYQTMPDLIKKFGKRINRKAEVVWTATGVHSKITHFLLGKNEHGESVLTEVVLVFKADLSTLGSVEQGYSNVPKGFADNGEIEILSNRNNVPKRHVHYMGRLIDRK